MSGIVYEISAVDKFSKTFDDLEKKMSGLDKFSGPAKAAGAAFTAAGAGIAAALGSAVGVGKEFNAQMSRVAAISDASAEELDQMKQAALDLGASTSKSASEVAKGFEEMAAMGFSVQDVLSAMPGVIAASEASGADMAQVAEVMASTLNAFGMEAAEASRVADILAKTANVSAADITDMQYALKYAAPSANALGISLEELAAATGIMTNAGMRGEQAGTTLRMALARLVDPPKEAANALSDLGISVIDGEGNFKSMSAILGDFTIAMTDMTDAQKLATLAQIFGTEAASGMLNLIAAGPAQFDEFTASIANSAGESARAAAIMKDNLAGSLEEMGGAFETAAISISDALEPAIRFVVDAVTGLVNWFNNLSEGTRTVIAVVAALTAGFALIAGPILLLIGFLPSMIAGFGALATAFGVTSGALLGVIGTIGLVVVAIGALVAGIVWLWNTNEEFRNTIIAIWNEISSFVSELVGSLVSFLQERFGAFLDYVLPLLNEIKDAFINRWKEIWSFLEPALNNLLSFWKNVWNGIKNALRVVVDAIGGMIDGVLMVFEGVIEFLAGVFTGNWERAWNGVVRITEGVGKAVLSAIKGAINGAIAIVNGFIDGFNSISISVPSVDIPLVGTVGGFTIGMPKIPKIPMLDIGTDEVKSTGLAVIHEGESVVPAKVARGGFSGGGGAQIVINATYVDPTAAERFAAEVDRIMGRRIGGKWA